MCCKGIKWVVKIGNVLKITNIPQKVDFLKMMYKLTSLFRLFCTLLKSF